MGSIVPRQTQQNDPALVTTVRPRKLAEIHDLTGNQEDFDRELDQSSLNSPRVPVNFKKINTCCCQGLTYYQHRRKHKSYHSRRSCSWFIPFLVLKYL